MKRHAWLIVAVLLVLAWEWWGRGAAPTFSAGSIPAEVETRPAPAEAKRKQFGNEALSPEVASTLRLIRAGGPFPFARDGVVFGNYEGRLPSRPRGYYHEYTVPTPGLSHRGARRIVAGGDPPREFWYSGDHYESFQRIEARP